MKLQNLCFWVALQSALLSGCSTIQHTLATPPQPPNTQMAQAPAVVLALKPEQQQALAQRSAQLLDQPLASTNAAVELMLANSAQFQAMLADHWQTMSQLAQAGRMPNPVLAFERLRTGSELELDRLVRFGLIELLTLPWRYQASQLRLEQQQLEWSAQILEHMHAVELAWIDAVAAEQKRSHAHHAWQAAQASAQLAQRMRQAGNFSARQSIEQALMHAQALQDLKHSEQETLARKEALVRKLGLNSSQAMQLQLPNTLPAMPTQARSPQGLGQQALQRLDVQMAAQAYQAQAQEAGLERLASILDLQVGLRRNTTFDNSTGTKSTGKGYELELRLPIFDWGTLQRQATNAALLKSTQELQATLYKAESQLRQSYGHYRIAFDMAEHQYKQVLPLYSILADQTQKRYNGMLIGVFELLAEHRQHMQAQQAAVDALANLYKAEIALDAALQGSPTPAE